MAKRTRKSETTVLEEAEKAVEKVENIEQIVEETAVAVKTKDEIHLQVQVPLKPVEEDITPKPARFRKTGKGSLRWGNRIIKPGQVFEAYRKDVPKAFMDTLEELDPEIMPEKFTQKVQPAKFSKQAVEEGFNIVDAHGRALNDNVLSEQEADDLLKQLL